MVGFLAEGQRATCEVRATGSAGRDGWRCRRSACVPTDSQRRATRRPAVTDLERALHGRRADPREAGCSRPRPPWS